jgi:hypothetical protein
VEAVGSAELFAEAFDAAGGVDEFLFTCEEGVALIADIDADSGLGAAGLERIAARAVDGTGHVTGMGFFFHDGYSLTPARAWQRIYRHVSRCDPIGKSGLGL